MARTRRLLALAAAFAATVSATQTADAQRAQPATITVNGQQRTYLIAQPGGDGPKPTIIMLHGLGGQAPGIAGATKFVQLGQRDGFVSVFPNGLARQWNVFPPGTAPKQFTDRAQRGGGIGDDVAFVKMLVADLVKRGISDP